MAVGALTVLIAEDISGEAQAVPTGVTQGVERIQLQTLALLAVAHRKVDGVGFGRSRRGG